MRNLRQFAFKEWLELLPLQHALKQVRNDLLLHRYLRGVADGEAAFLSACEALRGANIALIIAFEQPWALDWLLTMSQRNLTDSTVLVFDNSQRAEARTQIAAVCQRHGARLLGLPHNPTRHVNRSHGMAMSWVYEHIVRRLAPARFAFLDHDLIPMVPLSFTQRLGDQPCFGLLNESAWGWQVWAGYSVFRYASVSALPMNFLYDFSRALDTGGRSWPCFYRTIDPRRLRLAAKADMEIRNPLTGEARLAEVVDRDWLHMRSIGYNNNAEPKRAFFEGLARACEQGVQWSAMSGNPLSATTFVAGQ